MYIIFLNKLRLDQISCSGRNGTRWQYGVPKWHEIVQRLGTPALQTYEWQLATRDPNSPLLSTWCSWVFRRLANQENRCQPKFLTSAKFLTCCCFWVILPLSIKK